MVAKIGGFGPVVAVVSSAAELTCVRGCLVSRLQGVKMKEPWFLEAGGLQVMIQKLVRLTVQVGDLVVDVLAAAMDQPPVPLVLGRNWSSAACESYWMERDRKNGDILRGIVVNDRHSLREVTKVKVKPSTNGEVIYFDAPNRVVGP